MIFEWSGDVDLGDGHFEKQYHEYMEYVSTVKHINHQLSNVEQRILTTADLLSIKGSIVNDLSYIDKGI